MRFIVWVGRQLLRFVVINDKEWMPNSVAQAWGYLLLSLAWVVVPLAVLIVLFLFVPTWIPILVIVVGVVVWFVTIAMARALQDIRSQ